MKEYYCGLDLHSSNVFIGILDEKEKRVFQKRSPNDILVILEYLKPFKGKDERCRCGIHIQLVLVG